MLRPWKLNLKISDTNSCLPLYLQIANAIIHAIESASLRKGEVLPGTRRLALSLQVSRNTIIESYNYLEQEGWLFSIPKGGTFVSHNLPEKILHYKDEKQELNSDIVFDQGLPDARHSPILDIIREYRRTAAKIHRGKIVLKTDPLGYKKLRIKISQMLSQQRRLEVYENSICITRGSQMGIFLLSQCLFEKGNYVIVEHPGYRLAWDAFTYAGAEVIMAEVDGEGIIVSEVKKIIKEKKTIKAVYISPNSQFPTTVILNESRRKELIELSHLHNFFIIEDDYCIDINYEKKFFPTLCSDHKLKNYIYIGTFSRSVSPLLKLGYIVGHHEFITRMANLRSIIDISGDTVMEVALFNVIQDGIFSRHIKRYTLFYKQKRDIVDLLLKKYLHDKITYEKPQLGLGFWITPTKPSNFCSNIVEELESKNVMIISSDYYQVEGRGFYLSFGSADIEKIEYGIQLIAGCL